MNETNNNAGIKPVLVMLACVLYILSPIDLLPDFLPVVGWLDDLGVLGFLVHTYMAYKKQTKATLSRQEELPQLPVLDVPAKRRIE